MPPFKVFVSHVWRRHHEYYWGLIRLLDDASRFSFVDLSVPKIRPFDGTDWSDVQDEILVLLRSADVVLTINTPAITRSKAVREELTEAENCGIPIIAISLPKRRGRGRSSLFGPVQRAEKADWSTRSIVAAIRKAGRRSAMPVVAIEGYESTTAVAVPLVDAEIDKVRGDDEAPDTPVLSRDFRSLLVRPTTQ